MIRKVKVVIYYDDRMKPCLGKRVQKYISNTLYNDYFLMLSSVTDEKVKINDKIEL